MIERVLKEIKTERKRQDAKWGVQNHNNDLWLTILVEEIGEVAKNMQEHKPVNEELTQVAAVAVAWLESNYRNGVC